MALDRVPMADKNVGAPGKGSIHSMVRYFPSICVKNRRPPPLSLVWRVFRNRPTPHHAAALEATIDHAIALPIVARDGLFWRLSPQPRSVSGNFFNPRPWQRMSQRRADYSSDTAAKAGEDPSPGETTIRIRSVAPSGGLAARVRHGNQRRRPRRSSGGPRARRKGGHELFLFRSAQSHPKEIGPGILHHGFQGGRF